MNFYLTADWIGSPSGGGVVTYQESTALHTLGPRHLLDEQTFAGPGAIPTDPFEQDQAAYNRVAVLIEMGAEEGKKPVLAHCYSGCLTKTVDYLRWHGCKVAYTAAAHDVDLSKREHEKLGLQFNYPHLTDPFLWRSYLDGYKQADVLVCPSNHSKEVMRKFGCEQRIEVIPHGVDLPKAVKPLPQQFTVGYLGAIGPDKGLMYLLQAWKKLAYKDAVLLIGGSASLSPFMTHMLMQYGGGNIRLLGWVENVADFYNAISLYIQPSVSEGFGIEVLEAMAHSRTVLCSTGAGAADVVPRDMHFNPADVDSLADQIKHLRKYWNLTETGFSRRRDAEQYSWDKIRQRYVDLWRGLL